MFSPPLFIARLIDAVRLNRTAVVERSGRVVYLKHRRPGLRLVIMAGNVFLRLSKSRIQLFSSVADWQDWEMTSYKILHGPSFVAGKDGPRGLWFDRLPGRSLYEIMENEALNERHLAAAAREFRRCHSLSWPGDEQAWSHGDPHLENVIYDPVTDQARLIDFETRHDPWLPALQRHADDLLVFLLDLMGRLPKAAWVEVGRFFLSAYGRPEVSLALESRLSAPRGMERVLWATRTRFIPLAEMANRLHTLKWEIQRP